MSEECTTSQVYQKPPPRPVPELSLTSSFQECTAMDLKILLEEILFHLIDQATQLPATKVIPSKAPDTVINAILIPY